MEYQLNKKIVDLFKKYKNIGIVAYLCNMKKIDVYKILKKEV